MDKIKKNLKMWKDLSPGDLFSFEKDDIENSKIFLNWVGSYYTSGWLNAKIFDAQTSEIISWFNKEEEYVLLHK